MNICNSSVTRGSVLVSLLFATCINNFEINVQNMIHKLVDDIKIGDAAKCEQDICKLKGDIDQLVK